MHTVNIQFPDLFQALGDNLRLRIMRMLVLTKTEVCLCELSDSLSEPEYKVSRHLKMLKSSGLITAVRDGKWVYHGLVKGSQYLRLLHMTIKSLPDDDQQLKRDLERLSKRMKSRQDGRCRTLTTSTVKSAQ